MKFKNTLLAAALVSLPVLAQAQPVSGPYVAAGAGANLLNGTDVTGNINGTSVDSNTSVDFNWGYVGVLSLGWGFGNGLRAEVEGSYRQNDVDSLTLRGRRKTDVTGRVTSYGVMANILYDIDLGAPGGITPYVGAGAGYMWSKLTDVGNLTSEQFTGETGNWAGQGIVGLSMPISAVPGLALTAEYRYVMTGGVEVDKSRNRDNGANTNRPASLSLDNVNHSVLVGLRYAFNAAPAVAAVAPAAAAKTFLVFFDWNKADLTDRAKQIIGEAASSRGQGVTRLEVNGYTDRSGSDQYNQGLSVRRANAVAAELVRRGVPRNEIVTRGFGEANPLVPTADGVREPQNRRVEIILK